MAIERGISISSAVMSFEDEGLAFNLLDTPGHQDFSVDTYRTLTAVDSAVMVFDAAKGIKEQTRKLFEVCRLRDVLIITFINKIDREGRDPFHLLDEIEPIRELGRSHYVRQIARGGRDNAEGTGAADMSRMLHAWRLSPLVVAAAAAWIGTAQAHEMLYDQNGYKLAVGIEAGLGGFAVGNADTGAGNVNTDAPPEVPFPPSECRTTRDWFEGFIKPFAELETPFFDFGHTHALVSVVGALSRGNGDATSSLAPQGARSTTSDAAQHALEDAVIG